MAAWGSHFVRAPEARAATPKLGFKAAAQVEGLLHELRVLMHMNLIEVLFHVPVVSHPEMTYDTVLCKLESDSWHAKPLFPCIKSLQESSALDQRHVGGVFFSKNAKASRRWQANLSGRVIFRDRGPDGAFTSEAAAGARLYMRDKMSPTPELAITELASRHA